MNVFYLHEDPYECALMHNNSHCSKMIIEYAQLLSTAHRICDGQEYYGKTANGRKIKRWLHPIEELESVLYKASHVNHPSAIWARKSKENYIWLYKLWVQLSLEYTVRYGRTHATFEKLISHLFRPPVYISDEPFTPPTPAMPDDAKLETSLLSYRNYYNKYKQHLAKWKVRDAPEWFSYAN